MDQYQQFVHGLDDTITKRSKHDLVPIPSIPADYFFNVYTDTTGHKVMGCFYNTEKEAEETVWGPWHAAVERFKYSDGVIIGIG